MRFWQRNPTKPGRYNAGFTLIEVLIIAPIVILVISGFVALMIALIGDVLASREYGVMAYETQDALERIEQDTRLSTQFLATSGTLESPQGSNNNFTGTSAFAAASNTLILGSLTTDKNPADTTRKLVYYAGQPNPCGTSETYNRVLQSKVMYFLKDGSLWRRAVLPNYNTNVSPDDYTVCAAAWQRNTCSPNYSTGTRCQTNDTEVMKNVDTFSVKYLSSASSTTDLGGNNALSANALEITINGIKQVAGRTVTSGGTVRATKLNNIDVEIPAPSNPTVSGQILSSPTVVFSWAKVPLASSYVISYNINGGSWIDATTNSQTTSYSVAGSLGATVTLRVAARNSTGTSAYDTTAVVIPTWTNCSVIAPWLNFGSGFSEAAYAKSNDVVMLKGLVKSGAIGGVICKLPAGYRPTHRLVFQVSSGSNTPGRVDVYPNGDITMVTGNNGWLALDNINFVASGASYSFVDPSPPFSNGWTNYGGAEYSPLRYTKDPMGRSHLQGLVKSGVFTNPTAVTSLPATYAPPRNTIVPAASNSTFNLTDIATNIYAKGIDGATYYSLQSMFIANGYTGTWTPLPMSSGWVAFDAVSYPTPEYTKTPDGVVSVKGMIKSGTTTFGTTIGTLPAGYRPKEKQVILCVGNYAYCRVDVQVDGRITVEVVNATWTSLNFSFPAEQ